MSSKSVSSEWSLDAGVILIHNGVPDSVELVSSIVILQRPVVTAFITIGVLIGVSVRAMERLMDITHIVNDQTKSDGFGFVIRLGMRFDSLNGEATGNIFTFKIFHDCRHSSGDVLGVILG